MTKKIMKSLAVVMCAVLLVAGSIAGTMAYLTSNVNVNNTFTSGNVTITMDEAPVNALGKKTDGNRVTENSYKLVPGRVFDKDPIIRVDANSEECYLFVKIDNGISLVEANSNTIASQMATNGWLPVPENSGVYYYQYKVSAGENINTFKTFTVDTAATNAEISGLANATVVVYAYAVQAEGFTDVLDAWAKAPSTFGA